jgi:fatty acid desaturase
LSIVTEKPQTQPRALSTYASLSKLIKEANLLDRNVAFYIRRFIQVSLLALMAWGAVLLMRETALVLLIAPVLGILGAQYGFLAHELSHKQVFNSPKLNKWFALFTANLLVGLSIGWWDKKKHNLHHANPNTEDKDPDIKIPIFAFTKEDYDSKTGVEKMLTKYQGYLFPFLLLFTGFDLLKNSVQTLLTPSFKADHRFLELFLIIFRTVAPAVFLFMLLSPWVAGGFILIQMGVFGLFMGGAFAPNHKGMPIIPRGQKVDYFNRQVLTSRDIKPNWLIDNLMGGLNYQVEHHLFPSMARPNLRKAQKIVKEFCATHNVPYAETGLFRSYGIVMQYLNKVGLKHSDPFLCPLVSQLRQV